MRATHALRHIAHGGTLDRLHEMTVKLKDRLIEAEDIRVRFTKAHECAHPGDEVHLP